MREGNICAGCDKEIKDYESYLYLGILVGTINPLRLFTAYDKHIRCSPSRAQHIHHPKFKKVVDKRPEFDVRLWLGDEGSQTEERAQLYKHLYTNAWVRLQYQYNPNFQESNILNGN
jgi:hypothetical protein